MATIVAVFFLILVGGIVRATGSGMGCPDWPKCFGSWVPPTEASQLPANYKAIYGAKLRGEVEFNAFKTWTEYVNRLVGVLIGIFVFGAFVLSWREYRKSNKQIVWLSLFAFVMVAVEGGLGARVVATELNPILITVHMLLAVGIVFSLIYALLLSYRHEGWSVKGNLDKANRFLLSVLFILSMGQLILGTQVRELIDEAYNKGMARTTWLDVMDGRYYVHIALATIIVVLAMVFYRNLKFKFESNINKLIALMSFSVLLEYIVGGVLGLFKIPAALQPVHLLLGTIIVSLQFVLIQVFRERGI